MQICFVLQLLGAAFLAIGLWAWKEKVRINADAQPWRASPLQQHSSHVVLCTHRAFTFQERVWI